MIKIRIYVLILCFSMGCSTFQWKQPVHRSPELPLVFNKYQSLGTGLKLADIGYHAMPCLESFEKELSGGVLDIEFRRVDDQYEGKNLEIDRFIKSGIKRANRFNPGSREPASFVLIIKVKNRLASIKEETIRFRADVEKLIYTDNRELFFRTCGTEYIHTVKFDSEIFFFFSYYPESPENAALLEKEIKNKITENRNNVFQISIFKDLELEAETFFSLKVDTDVLVEPIEFAFKKIHGKQLDLTLNKLIHSVLNSDNGRTKHYILNPWTKLDALRSRMSLSGDRKVTGYSDEQIFKSLQLLESSIRQYRLRFLQIKRVEKESGSGIWSSDLSSCATAFENANDQINWTNFDKCRYAAISTNSVDLESLAECSVITEAISELNLSTACFGEIETGDTQSLYLNNNIYLPLELADRLVDDPTSIHRKDTEYRFNDDDQLESIPPKVMLGQGVDSTGRFYGNSCIIEESKQVGGKKNKRNITITNDYYPYELKEWPWIKKAFLFWKNSPQWTLYRGSFEIEGFSPVLLPSFEITDEAKQLAASSIVDFYKKFGTHYVERVRHRRGFIYYFSPDAAGYNDIEIFPFGMAAPQSDIPIPAEYAEKIPFLGGDNKRSCSLELSGLLILPMLAGAGGELLLGGVLAWACQDNIPALLDPKTVKEFFTNKEKLIMMFKNDDEAVPIRLSLKPWSEYLVNRGILTPEQLDLAELVE